MIERCNFDYYAYAEDSWNELMAGLDEEERESQAPAYTTYIENTVELAKEFDMPHEFTVYTIPFSTYDPEKSDTTILVPLPESEIKSNSDITGGHRYNEDGSIGLDNNYYFSGKELPVK